MHLPITNLWRCVPREQVISESNLDGRVLTLFVEDVVHDGMFDLILILLGVVDNEDGTLPDCGR